MIGLLLNNVLMQQPDVHGYQITPAAVIVHDMQERMGMLL